MELDAPEIMCQVLGNVYRTITHLTKKAGFTHNTAQAGAVKLIQRVCSALNLNIDFHVLFLDGAYIDGPNGARFRWVKVPTSNDRLQVPVQQVDRVGLELADSCRLGTPPRQDFLYLGMSVFLLTPAVYLLSKKDSVRNHQTFAVIYRLTLHLLKDETDIRII